MLIGEVAAEAGVSVQTVRFYERRGLLKEPRRLASGYRDYPAETALIVRCIREFQEHGFTLKEIECLIGALERGRLHRAELRDRLTAKLASLELRIESLQQVRGRLRQLTHRLDHDDCPDLLSFDRAFRDAPVSLA